MEKNEHPTAIITPEKMGESADPRAETKKDAINELLDSLEKNPVKEPSAPEGESKTKTVAKKTLRVFGYNVDLIMLLVYGILCGWAGYSFAQANIHGLTAEELSKITTQYLEGVFVMITALAALLTKLLIKPGIISERLREIFSKFCQETFKPKENIDACGNTFFGDKKIYRG